MTNTPQDAVERVERALLAAKTDGFTPEIEQVFLDCLPTLLSLTKPDEEMVARAIAGKGAPFHPDAWRRLAQDSREHYLSMARAAIKAITLDLYDGQK